MTLKNFTYVDFVAHNITRVVSSRILATFHLRIFTQQKHTYSFHQAISSWLLKMAVGNYHNTQSATLIIICCSNQILDPKWISFSAHLPCTQHDCVRRVFYSWKTWDHKMPNVPLGISHTRHQMKFGHRSWHSRPRTTSVATWTLITFFRQVLCIHHSMAGSHREVVHMATVHSSCSLPPSSMQPVSDYRAFGN